MLTSHSMSTEGHPEQGRVTPTLEERRGQDAVAPPTPEQSFRKIESSIRAILRHNKHVPKVSILSNAHLAEVSHYRLNRE